MVRLLIYVFNVVLVFVVSWFVARILREVSGDRKPRPGGANPNRTPSRREFRGETARDPVCGMFVSTELSRRLERDGKVLHFCSPECLEKYQLEARRS